MTTNSQQRHRRKHLLANMLETMRDIPEERVLAIFSLKEQISVKKAREYLTELKLAKIVEQEAVIG